jgi:ribosomal protein S20
MYNKSTKSEVATRIKKVMQSVADAQAAGNAGSAAMAVLLSEAYKCIDQAAAKGILKKNTAARRKSLVGRAVGSVATAAA